MTRVKSIGCLAVAMLLAAGGCHKPPPPPPPPPPAVWHPPTNRADQLREMSQRVEEMNSALGDLPGSSTEDHRQRADDILKNLAKVLRLAEGNNASPEFENRLAVVEASEATLSHANLPRPQMEASENEAVRASIAALEQITGRYLGDDEKIPPMLDTAKGQLDSMYTIGGPMHDLVASDGLRAVGEVIKRVSSDLIERNGGGTNTAAPTKNPS